MRANDDVEIYLRFPDLQYRVGQRSERIPVRLIIQRSSFLVLPLSLILSFSIYICLSLSFPLFLLPTCDYTMHAIGTNESARSRQRDSTFYSNWIANRDRILSLNEDARTLSHDGVLFVSAISISIRPIGRKFGYAANDATPQPDEVGRFAVLSKRHVRENEATRNVRTAGNLYVMTDSRK